jgi:flagellar FliJ protein
MATQSTAVLKMLQEMAVKEVELATEALAKALKDLDAAKKQEEMLHSYKEDYLVNMKKSLDVGVTVDAYQNYHQFMGKLEQAITGQREAVKFAEGHVKGKKLSLQEAQRKKLSYDVLLERADKRVLKAELKRDQKMMDEFASRATRIKS